MKKFFKYAIASIIIVLISGSIYIYTSKYKISVYKDGVKSELVMKGLERATGLTVSNRGECYLSYEDKILKINEENNVDEIYANKNLKIEDMKWYEDSLIILSKDKLIKYDLKEEKERELLRGIPYGNERIKRKIECKDNYIYVAIGSFTNAGVTDNPKYYDKTAINIKLNGVNFNGGKTGAFKPFEVASKEGEELQADPLGNSSIIELDLHSGKFTTFATGIKNVNGMGIDSNGDLIATVEGIKKDGTRGVVRDTDYIYTIKKGTWYGFPDYSGGDPITSPKFSDGEKIKPIIMNPPEKVIQTPIYEHSEIDSLGTLVVDKNGEILDKDEIIFFDKISKKLYCLNKGKVIKEFAKMDRNAKIEDLEFYNEKMYILDSNSGYLYSIKKDEGNFLNKIPQGVVIIVILTIIATIVIVVNKELKRKKR